MKYFIFAILLIISACHPCHATPACDEGLNELKLLLEIKEYQALKEIKYQQEQMLFQARMKALEYHPTYIRIER